MVEIVGVAGAGKSTLSRAICQHDRACQLGPFLDVGRLAHTPYVLHSLIGLIPLVIAGLSRQPRMSWREIKLVIYVSEWRRYLSRNCRPESKDVRSGPGADIRAGTTRGAGQTVPPVGGLPAMAVSE